MRSATSSSGLVILCRQDGTILKVLHNNMDIDDIHLTGKVFSSLVEKSNFQKAMNMLLDLKSEKLILDREFNLKIDGQILFVHAAGIMLDDQPILLLSQSQINTRNLFGEILRINNEQTNRIRALTKENADVTHSQISQDAQYDEFSRLNNELVNLQRELVKKNLELERLNAELEQRVAKRTEELNKRNLDLQLANKAKDEFLAIMSHELRTPLNSILGLSETLLEQLHGPLNTRQQKSLSIIEASGHHLLELINDILDIASIEAGRFDIYPEVVDVDTLCLSSVAFVREQALVKSISLEYELDETVTKIHADRRRLEQILVNLLTNAVKFTAANGQVYLKVRAVAEHDLLQFSVTDTGIGISPEDLKRLFRPFVQADSSLSRKFEGTGLGLALVQRLTDLHGGSVQVQSEVGRGSTFTINLPWKINVDEEQEGIITSRPEVIDEPTINHNDGLPEPVTVLLVEDTMSNVLTIREYLESHGYEVLVAKNGQEAIYMAKKNNPDIILMDIQMPVMDGLVAIRKLRTDPRFTSTPIIALTALAMPGDREHTLAAGADEYLSKPISLKSLRQTIRSLLYPKKPKMD